MASLARTCCVFDCATMDRRPVLPSLVRGVLGDIAERTASFGYISVMRPSPAGEIRREGGSRPKVITLISMPVVGSRRTSVSSLKLSSCEVSRIA